MNLQDKAAHFARLKELQERHLKAAEVLGSAMDQIGQELFADFADSGTAESLRITGAIFMDGQARTVKPIMKYKPSVIVKPLFFEWMTAHGHGALIKEDIHHKSLEGWVTKEIEANAEMPGEDLLKVFKVTTASVRRLPK